MAGFSLSRGGGGGGGGEGNHHNQEIPPEHLFLLRNQEISSSYNKSLELWQQQQQEQHHHHHQEIYPITMGMGVGPSSMRHQGSDGVGGSSSGGGISCQDCGNQAKKDCSYMRCRTCCKTRGFDCSTHLKSTWVPASRRRERQQQIQQHLHLHEQPPTGQQDLRSENPKRPREHKNTTTSTVAVVAPLHLPSTSAPAGLQMANFPAEVSSPAMFRCVRVVSAMDEGEDQYAYQTAVSIGGHLFKGILYDQGPDNPYGSGGGGEGGRITGSTSNTNVISTSAMMDPSSMYPPPLNTFLADLTCKRKKWLPTLRNHVSHINDTFSHTFQEMAVGKVSLDENGMDFDKMGSLSKSNLGEQDSFRFEVPIISPEGNDQFQPFSIWCLCKTLLTACPFRVVDEINQGMDPINERNMFQQLVRAASQPNMLQ